MRTLLSKGVSPAEVVLAENLHRRHLTVSQRSQIKVGAHEWLAGGGDRRSENFKGQNCLLKTTTELAAEANVSPAKFVLVEKLHRRYLMATQGGQPSVEVYHTGGKSGCTRLKGMSFCVISVSSSLLRAFKIFSNRFVSGAVLVKVSSTLRTIVPVSTFLINAV